MIWDEPQVYKELGFNGWLLEVLEYFVQFLFYTKFKYFLGNWWLETLGQPGDGYHKQLNTWNCKAYKEFIEGQSRSSNNSTCQFKSKLGLPNATKDI